MNYINEELSELYNRRKKLANKIANFFHGGQVYEGDRGYQDLLQELDSVEEQINDFNND